MKSYFPELYCIAINPLVGFSYFHTEPIHRHFPRAFGIPVAEMNFFKGFSDKPFRPVRFYLAVFLRFFSTCNFVEPLPVQRQVQNFIFHGEY